MIFIETKRCINSVSYSNALMWSIMSAISELQQNKKYDCKLWDGHFKGKAQVHRTSTQANWVNIWRIIILRSTEHLQTQAMPRKCYSTTDTIRDTPYSRETRPGENKDKENHRTTHKDHHSWWSSFVNCVFCQVQITVV